MPQERASAIHVFRWIRSYWTRHGRTAIDAADPEKMTRADMRALGERLLEVCNDQVIGGERFEAHEMTIEGNDATCVKGTILDVRADMSPIRPYERIVAACGKSLLAWADGKPQLSNLCKGWCVGCKEISPAKCIGQAQQAFSDVFDEGGVFDDIEAAAERGEWRLEESEE